MGRLALWLGIITVLGGLFSYLTRRIFAVNLTVEEYGLFYSVFALIFFFQSFRNLGMQESMVYNINRFRASKDLSSIKGAILLGAIPQLILGFIIAGILLLLKDFMVLNYFQTPLAEATYILLLLVFIIEPFISVMQGILLGLEKIILYRILVTIRYLFILGFAYFLFPYYDNHLVPAISYLYGTILNLVLCGIIFLPLYYRTKTIKTTPSKTLFFQMLNYAIPITFSTAGIIILQYSDIILLTILRDSVAVGLYNIALPAIMVAVVLMTPIYVILFPTISRLYHNKSKEDITRLLSLVYNNIMIVLLPISIVFMIFPAEIISILFDADFVGATNTLRVFSITFIFMVLKDVGFAALAGLGLVKERSRIVYYAAAGNVLFNLMLIPLFGATGAAIGTGIGFGVMSLLSYVYVRKKYDIIIEYGLQLRIIIMGLLYGITLYLLSLLFQDYGMLLRLLLSGIISLPILLMLMIILKIITKEKILLAREYY